VGITQTAQSDAMQKLHILPLHFSPPHRRRGFTMVELVMAIAVLTVLVTLAIPGFTWVMNIGRVNGPANELLATLQHARMESFRIGQRTVVCRSDNAETAAPTCNTAAGIWRGWLAFVDMNRDGDFNGLDVRLRATAVRQPAVVIASTNISTASSRVVFRPDGLARQANGALLAAQIRVCVPTRQPRDNARDLEISGGARVSVVRRNAAGLCPAPAN
jgi:type IV fimbrial biogenesis protein FimT